MRAEVAVGLILTLAFFGFITPTNALDPSDRALQIDPSSMKMLSASIAFFAAAIGAGIAIGRAGSAGLAATAERPEVRTTAIIITALGEAIAIYGIVMAIIILGQEV